MDKTLKTGRPGFKFLLGHFGSCNLEQVTSTISRMLNQHFFYQKQRRQKNETNKLDKEAVPVIIPIHFPEPVILN